MVATTPLEHDLKLLPEAFLVLLSVLPAVALAEMHVVVIEGIGGEPRYTEQFGEQIVAIESAARSLTAENRIRVFRADDVARDAVLQYFEDLKTGISETDQVALYLIGR